MRVSMNLIGDRSIIWRGLRYFQYLTKIVSKGVLLQFVNFYYGNTAGFWFNYGAKRQLRRLQKEYPSELPEITVDAYNAAHQVTEYGYTLIQRVSSLASINAAVNKVQASFLDEDLFATSPNGASWHLLNPEKIPEIKELFNETINNILIAYYGCAFRINTVRIWRTMHVSGVDSERHDVFSNTFHHDNVPVNGLKIFILLTDGVNRDTGAFRFHDAVESRKIVRTFGYFHRFMQTKRILRRLTNPETLHFFEGDRGDCAIVNTQECLHGASIPKLGSHRDILQFEVYPDNGKLKDKISLFENISPDVEILRYKQN